jgi:hypothetical protein
MPALNLKTSNKPRRTAVNSGGPRKNRTTIVALD